MRSYLALLVVSSICFSSCKNETKVIKSVKVSFKKEGELTLYKSTSDSIIAKLDIEIADTDYDVQTGLMYRNSMLETRGMLFVFPTMKQRFFYMKNTRIPLDLIYLDDKMNIVSFQENAQPFNEDQLPSTVQAKYVLEINAGLAEKWLLEIGDRMDYSHTQEK